MDNRREPSRARLVNRLEREIKRLKQQIQESTYCAYCGHEYPRGTPKSRNRALTEHIKVCLEHPMRRAEERNRLLYTKLVKTQAALATVRTNLKMIEVMAAEALRTDEMIGMEQIEADARGALEIINLYLDNQTKSEPQ